MNFILFLSNCMIPLVIIYVVGLEQNMCSV